MSSRTFDVRVGYSGTKTFMNVEAESAEEAELLVEELLDLETFYPDDIYYSTKEVTKPDAK